MKKAKSERKKREVDRKKIAGPRSAGHACARRCSTSVLLARHVRTDLMYF
jgi:hypothetical protein